jgi:hypothetical protein
MEHLIIWLIEAILKALTQRAKPDSRRITGAEPRPAQPARPGGAAPNDVWADYRRKQAAIEREMMAKSPTTRKS